MAPLHFLMGGGGMRYQAITFVKMVAATGEVTGIMVVGRRQGD